MRRLCLLLTVVLVTSADCFAQSKKAVLTFEQLFPEDKQREIGLQKLSAVEKEALRAYVESLMVAGLRLKVTSGGGTTGGGIYAGVGQGHWIKENIDRGAFIVLEDKSLWKIDPFNKLDAALWLNISNITVVESSGGSPGYDYLLINTDDGEKAHANYMGKQ